MKYFYINGIKFNYDLEFNVLNPKDKWKLNAPLIEYFETLGITIPHYCYHKDLSIAGNCRMCLIELKKSPKPIVSCAMNAKSSLATNGEIYTNSPLVKKARENIMEFLLLNHPLDCPICDQGGECDLQDQSLFFGVTKKRFYNFQRVVTNKNIGPIVKTVMTRCIHCTRCVRFASEIAGVEHLGIFGRGISSEIGTYVNKIFQSELSGNVIEICPVGALTLKPYSFISRNWELKSINSIDLSDGFGINTQIFLKNNKIVKILPGYDFKNKSSNWISNKTRFVFDGMFTPDRKTTKTITSGNLNNVTLSNWEYIFKDLTQTIYFYDHLNRHFLKISRITFVIDQNVSLEVVNLLQLIKKKFSFFNIRKNARFDVCNDFESNMQTDAATDLESLNQTDLCLLIGVNTRYEGYHLNLKLKKRISKGNFKVFSLNSIIDLTFPVSSLGNNIKVLKKVVEGNHVLCQNIKESKRFLIVVNSDVYERNDFKSIVNLVQLLKINTTLQTHVWNGYNLLNNSLNSNGIHLLNKFRFFNKNDFRLSNMLYFINTGLNKNNLSKLIDLKLLNYLAEPLLDKCIVEQNNKLSNLSMDQDKTNSYKHFYFPNNVFYENTGEYINTEGVLKKTVKIVSPKNNTKNDWQILRKFYSTLNSLTLVSHFSHNNKIQFNCNNFFNFKNFTSFLYLNISSLSKLCFYIPNKVNQNYIFKSKKFNLTRINLNNTIIKKNVYDFYTSGSENYSNFSPTLIDCSNVLRTESINFN